MLSNFKFWVIPLLVLFLILDALYFKILSRNFGRGAMLFYFLIAIIFIEYYSFQAFKTITQNGWAIAAYLLFHLALYGSIIYFNVQGRSSFSSPYFKKILILMSLFLIPKIFLALSLFVDDLLRILGFGYQQVTNGTAEIPGRRKAAAWLAIGIASIPFLAVLDGILFGKYRYRVIKKTLYFDDLPPAFDGFTITQISDVHSGSFDNLEKVDYGVKMAANQNSDILIFTGDMVNNESQEFEPYLATFKQLKAKDGMFATLGNHDYGDYGDLTAAEKKASVARLQQMQREIGFEPLNNEMRTITRGDQKINIIGIENFGASMHFPKKGDLRKASANAKEGEFNILLSHDPSFFDHDLPDYDNIINFPKKMHLTFSGHTHGMQFGIETPGIIKWSPVQYQYPKWAGLYETNGRYLYVNRGFGYLAFPGRVGEWPEITVIELKRKV